MPRPPTYFRYVDDTFVIFDNSSEHTSFLSHLNSLHPALVFTSEKEENNTLPFLDVLVEKDVVNNKFLTSVYRKPTFTGNYVRYDSFCHKRRKTSLVRTLVNRASKLCSIEKLPNELERLKSIFSDNGYPDYLVNRLIKDECSPKRFGPNRFPLFIKLPFIGKPSYRFERAIVDCVSKCFPTVSAKVVFSSKPILPKMYKDRLPTHLSQNIVYEYSCFCSKKYVGETSRTLKTRMTEHVPKCLRDYMSATKIGNARWLPEKTIKALNKATAKSGICNHLFNNVPCMLNYDDNRFTVVARARSKFHLLVLESIIISTRKPQICKQKKFDFHALLF